MAISNNSKSSRIAGPAAEDSSVKIISGLMGKNRATMPTSIDPNTPPRLITPKTLVASELEKPTVASNLI